jgi:deoxyribose-phosphate aldolase
VSLNDHLNEVFEQLLCAHSYPAIDKEQLINVMDYTLLEPNASNEQLRSMSAKASAYSLAAVCIFPHQLPIFQSIAANKATVINFPNGQDELFTSLQAIDDALSFGANEIDYVFPYPQYLQGNTEAALNQANAVIQKCILHGVKIKIILETGAFPNIDSIYQVSTELASYGCHFLKTSTGKIVQGASLSAAFAMLSAIKDSKIQCGIKVSGGIKSPIVAIKYVHLAEIIMGKTVDKDWFRIGTSNLLGFE